MLGDVPGLATSPSYGRAVIILAGTPLGNVGDASPRLAEAIRTADVIAAEDTRRSRRLAEDLGVTPQGVFVSSFEGNERQRATELVERARQGEVILVLTDGGMPTISDPGFRIVRAAIDAGVPVTCLPGGSAVTTALALSGLPTDRFVFEGFLPRKAGERATHLTELATEPRTMVFFEAPHRATATLQAMTKAFGADRQLAVCREMTKTYEEVVRGTFEQVRTHFESGFRGEVTIVVAGADVAAQRSARGLVSPDDWVRAVVEYESAGLDRRSAIAQVAADAGVGRRFVYDAVIAAKNAGQRP